MNVKENSYVKLDSGEVLISSSSNYILNFYHPENTYCINAPHLKIEEIHPDCDYVLDTLTVKTSTDGEKIRNNCQGKILLCSDTIGDEKQTNSCNPNFEIIVKL